MTDFDPLKAASEELTSLVGVHRVIAARARDAERRYTEAEADHNGLMLLQRFTAEMVDRQRVKLKALQEAAEDKQ